MEVREIKKLQVFIPRDEIERYTNSKPLDPTIGLDKEKLIKHINLYNIIEILEIYYKEHSDSGIKLILTAIVK